MATTINESAVSEVSHEPQQLQRRKDDGAAPQPILLSPPHVFGDERERVLSAIDSNWIAPTGPAVREFESALAERCGVAHAVALTSGSAAIHLGLIALGVQPGDDVLCATFTFAGSAFPIVYTGARPVFIDSEIEGWNIDPRLVAAELDRRAEDGTLPKAVVAVDLYGNTADYTGLRQACDRHDVPILEDAAEALGASHDGKPAGSLGAIGVVSFNGNKIITASSGGAAVTDDEELAAKMRFLSSQAKEPAPHYLHKTIGFNYGMSNLLAAFGSAQLDGLDARIAARSQTYEFYKKTLSHINGARVLAPPSWGQSNHWLTCATFDPAQCPSPEHIRLALAEDGIESRPLWKPMHQQPVFEKNDAVLSGVSDRLFDSGLCLPSGTSMSDADRERIALSLQRALS